MDAGPGRARGTKTRASAAPPVHLERRPTRSPRGDSLLPRRSRAISALMPRRFVLALGAGLCLWGCSGGRDRWIAELQNNRPEQRALAVKKLAEHFSDDDLVLFTQAARDPVAHRARRGHRRAGQQRRPRRGRSPGRGPRRPRRAGAGPRRRRPRRHPHREGPLLPHAPVRPPRPHHPHGHRAGAQGRQRARRHGLRGRRREQHHLGAQPARP